MTKGIVAPGENRAVAAQRQTVIGAAGDRGSVIAGVSYNTRGIVFARDREYSAGGVSTFGNNYRTAIALVPNADPTRADQFRSGGFIPGNAAVPGGCTAPGFTLTATRCFYDFTFVSADEAEIQQNALFTRANYEINEDWSTYLNASVSRVESFGRYAPTPATLFLPPNTPNNPTASPRFVRHRFAAAGNRDVNTDANTYDLDVGFQGRIGAFDVN